MDSTAKKLYILMVSIHGLIRGRELELGRDADTGGQTKYVVELAQALGEHPEVGRVDLLTQLVNDPQISASYAMQEETLSQRARIIRIPCVEQGYLPKEELWDFLDNFFDNTLDFIRRQDHLPSVIHTHYADAGYVGAKLSQALGIPLVHTGHSLGRVKRMRLLASGLKHNQIEEIYKMSRRVEAEENTLAAADLVITSTKQETEAQYGLYDYYQPAQMLVVSPGVDLDRFHPPEGNERESTIFHQISRFLTVPDKPMILALSRPDRRKNIITLVESFGLSRELREMANLVIVAGNRDDIHDMDGGSQQVMTEILLGIDQFDLYGKVSYPKHHRASDVPILYRLAALSGGVFVNPALTEPFGLTLLEAAASGLPIVATEDGGPTDIVANCANGFLVDPLDTDAIAEAILQILQDRSSWNQLAESGVTCVRRHYSWLAHTQNYVEALKPLVEATKPLPRRGPHAHPQVFRSRAIFSDLDKNLLSDPESLAEFVELIQTNRQRTVFGIATGRRLDSALRVMRKHRIPRPDVLITSLGTEIHYAPNLTRDIIWPNHIDHLWNPQAIRRLLSDLPGLKLQPKNEQSAYKISYYIDPEIAPDLQEINSLMHKNEQTVHAILAFGQFLDIVPVRASKGFAMRWFADQWNISLENILVAGGSGADEDMMRGNTLAVVVANRHHEELSELGDIDRIFFATQPFAAGILEAINHFDFFGQEKTPAP